LSTAIRCALALAVATAGACDQPDPRFVPDETLQRELGLTSADVVHTVHITGGTAEVADPATDTVPPGAYVQFVTTDWLVHEVSFDEEVLPAASLDFLRRTDQMASPPMLQRESRFVVSFRGAPPGRYPYRLEGNGGPGEGLIVVAGGEVRQPRSRR
jgi:plastocyanin